MALERMDKLVAASEGISRSQVKELVRLGRICINGAVAKRPEEKADPDRDTVTLDRRELRLGEHIYLMMNKPEGVISASRDHRDKTVVDLVPPKLRRRGLFAAGRLDKDTVGFVLITNDGDFAHRILSPKRHVPKTYLAMLRDPYDPSIADAFAKGLPLRDGSRCLPAQVSVEEEGEQPVVKVVLHEGMYHQIKRMFAACGNEVVQLRRTQMGNLPLDPKLNPGECREILPKEMMLILCETEMTNL